MTAPHLTALSPQIRDGAHAEEQRPKRADAEQLALGAAGIVIVVLTAGAFWLSYAHLADVAGQHGLGASPIRRWAWPATLDAFIVAGELLMLRAALRRTNDLWAIAVTATGSVGSIALNVAGVSGTDSGRSIPLLDYVVAAVPPAAAMIAFGILMRQIHQLVAPTADPFDTGSAQLRNRSVDDRSDNRRQDTAADDLTIRKPQAGSGRNLHPSCQRPSRQAAVRPRQPSRNWWTSAGPPLINTANSRATCSELP
ncbi:DUF2637 domain-containing protein [Streptomyces sp. NPDC047987]|uniref:DUF2637 domain-containing protein n=1 Tax=unclassified Streptomyces TaxID=2593676 RepID=UPI00342A2CB6